MKNDMVSNSKEEVLNTEVSQDTLCKPQTQSVDYSTFNEHSLSFNDSTTVYDLFKGLMFMFISCIFKCLFAITCKVIMEHNQALTSFQLLTYKTYYMFVISMGTCLLLFVTKSKLIENIFAFDQNTFLSLTMRAVLSVISTSLTILALKYMQISDVYAIYYIYPGVVIVFSFYFLREKVGWFDYVCLVTCFTGVILIIRPTFLFGEHNIVKPSHIFIFSVVLAAVIKASEDVILRGVGKVNCLMIPILYSTVGIALFPIPMCLASGVNNIFFHFTFNEHVLLLLTGLFQFLMQIFISLAIQNENAGRVSMVNYFQILLMYFSDIIIFKRGVLALDFIGVAMIFSFNFINGLKKVMARYKTLVEYKSRYKQQMLI